ncbi:MAG: manganese catalase family protein [Clostridia bacterium]|nr:manganese catalase family protein [Clostridia bacterium]
MDINNIQIRINDIYPEITNATNDSKTVLILKDLLSGRQGEITGIMQYFYQSNIARQIEPNIADLLEEIAIVEMQHMSLLMNEIIAFGGTPKYNNGKGQPFNSSYVNYTTKLKDMLDFNILGEQQAIQDYTNAQKFIRNQSLKDLINRIIEDEQLHLNAFKSLRNTVGFLSI